MLHGTRLCRAVVRPLGAFLGKVGVALVAWKRRTWSLGIGHGHLDRLVAELWRCVPMQSQTAPFSCSVLGRGLLDSANTRQGNP